MNDPKTLKILLAVVLIAGAAAAGYATYQKNVVVAQRDNYFLALQSAKTQQEADKIQAQYLSQTRTGLTSQQAGAFLGLRKAFHAIFGGGGGGGAPVQSQNDYFSGPERDAAPVDNSVFTGDYDGGHGIY